MSKKNRNPAGRAAHSQQADRRALYPETTAIAEQIKRVGTPDQVAKATRLVEGLPLTPPSRLRWWVAALAGVALLLGLGGFLVFNRGGGALPATATTAPTVAATAAPPATATPPPTLAPSPTAVPPTATPEPPAFSLTEAPAQTIWIGPAGPYTQTLTVPITATNPALADPALQEQQARAATFALSATIGVTETSVLTIPLSVQSIVTDTLVLELGALPGPLAPPLVTDTNEISASLPIASAPITFTLMFEDQEQPIQVVLGHTRLIRGVNPANEALDGEFNVLLVASDTFQYGFPYSAPNFTSTRWTDSGLRNGELLDILAFRDGWYKVRVRTNSTASVINQEFWVLRWIVDNTDK